MFDQVKADAIIAAIATGEPAYKAARAQGLADGTFWLWLSTSSSLAEKYARAKELGLERLADEILEIADHPRPGVRTTTRADGTTETVEGDTVDRARLQVDSRKWLLSKLAPKRYGDKLELEHGGTVNVTINESDA